MTNKTKKNTEELIAGFDDLCDEYFGNDIDVKMLKKGINDIISNRT